MKKVVFCLSLFLAAGTCAQAQQFASTATLKTSKPAAKVAVINWDETAHNFGKVTLNKPATATFKFKNTGEAPLVITEVKAGCGCTATDYTKEAIAPGKSGYIKATYNAATAGAFHKTVTVTANTTTEPVVLTLQGEVVAQ